MTSTIFFSALILSASAAGATETKTFDGSELRSIEMKTGSGDITVTGQSGSDVVVTADKRRFGDGCELTMETRGNRLVLESKSQPSWFGNGCQVSFKVLMPMRLALKMATGSGRVIVDRTIGRVDVRVGSGDVSINGTVSDLEARSGNGDITVNGMLTRADIKTGSGRIELTYDESPSSGDIEIRTGSGDATVYLPAQSRVSAELRAGSGRLRNDLPNDPNANFKIRMKAGSGDLRIKKR